MFILIISNIFNILNILIPEAVKQCVYDICVWIDMLCMYYVYIYFIYILLNASEQLLELHMAQPHYHTRSSSRSAV